jgi:hypothetical protein
MRKVVLTLQRSYDLLILDFTVVKQYSRTLVSKRNKLLWRALLECTVREFWRSSVIRGLLIEPTFKHGIFVCYKNPTTIEPSLESTNTLQYHQPRMMVWYRRPQVEVQNKQQRTLQSRCGWISNDKSTANKISSTNTLHVSRCPSDSCRFPTSGPDFLLDINSRQHLPTNGVSTSPNPPCMLYRR